MPDLTTDSKMMRHQQDKDTPETIEDDEGQARAGRGDTDEASRRDRLASADRPLSDPAKGQDDVLAENRSVRGEGEGPGVSQHEEGPLAQKDRSRA